MVRVTPGTFIPVTEDAEGIYYEALNGFLRLRGNDSIGGGLYVSKSRPGLIWVYTGDAQMSSKVGTEKTPYLCLRAHSVVCILANRRLEGRQGGSGEISCFLARPSLSTHRFIPPAVARHQIVSDHWLTSAPWLSPCAIPEQTTTSI